MPNATGIARTNANTETKTVTWSKSRMPKCIADVSVVTQLPPKRKKFSLLRASAGNRAPQQEHPDRGDDDHDQDARALGEAAEDLVPQPYLRALGRVGGDGFRLGKG